MRSTTYILLSTLAVLNWGATSVWASPMPAKAAPAANVNDGAGLTHGAGSVAARQIHNADYGAQATTTSAAATMTPKAAPSATGQGKRQEAKPSIAPVTGVHAPTSTMVARAEQGASALKVVENVHAGRKVDAMTQPREAAVADKVAPRAGPTVFPHVHGKVNGFSGDTPSKRGAPKPPAAVPVSKPHVHAVANNVNEDTPTKRGAPKPPAVPVAKPHVHAVANNVNEDTPTKRGAPAAPVAKPHVHAVVNDKHMDTPTKRDSDGLNGLN